MKKLTIFIGFMLFFLAVAADAAQPTLNEIRLGADRLVFDLTKQVEYEIVALHNPERLVIDLLHDANFAGTLPNIPKSVDFISKIDKSSPNHGVFRVVLHLKQPVEFEDFWLEPSNGSGYRLVMSLKTKSVFARPTANVQVAKATPPAPRVATHIQGSESKPAPRMATYNYHNKYQPVSGRVTSNYAGSPPLASRETVGKYKSYEPAPVASPTRTPVPQLESRSYNLKVNAPFPTKIGSGRELVVVIDPGHGAHDTGAVGAGGTQEKDVVLAIAKRLVRRINAEPGMRAVLTRSTDVFIPLRERVVRARKAKADLFVSIHADAAQNRGATGASVYTLSDAGASSSAARALAAKENASGGLVGEVSIDDKDRDLALTMVDMSISASIEASREVANNVLWQLSQIGDTHKGKVQYAAFAVLKAHDVPSILVETAYISNSDEELLLGQPAYQEKLAQSVFGGINEYFHSRPPAGSMMAQVVRRQEGIGEVPNQ